MASYLGYQQIPASALSGVVTLTVPIGCTLAVVQNNHATAPTRYTPALVAPTSTSGQTIAPLGGTARIEGFALAGTARFIGGGDLDIFYYGA